MSAQLENCPNKALHQLGPSEYLERAEWAEEMRKTYRQERCLGCGLWVIWKLKDGHDEAAHVEANQVPADP